jgi:hypothetical protein
VWNFPLASCWFSKKLQVLEHLGVWILGSGLLNLYRGILMQEGVDDGWLHNGRVDGRTDDSWILG